MSFRFVLTGFAASAALILSGCYNNPHTSLKHPGEGPDNYMSKPAVGPGTTAGGSTAGPQPRREEHGEGHVQPLPSGAPAGQHGSEHAGAATPQMQHDAGTPAGPASRTGNEKGGDGRGPAEHSEGKH